MAGGWEGQRACKRGSSESSSSSSWKGVGSLERWCDRKTWSWPLRDVGEYSTRRKRLCEGGGHGGFGFGRTLAYIVMEAEQTGEFWKRRTHFKDDWKKVMVRLLAIYSQLSMVCHKRTIRPVYELRKALPSLLDGGWTSMLLFRSSQS